MRILLYGDLQISRKRPDYMAFLAKTLDFLEQVIAERKPDLVVNLGDVFDGHGQIAVDDLVWGIDRMNAISALCEHWILSGNHDVSDRSAKISAIRALVSPKTRLFIDFSVVGTKIVVAPYAAPEEQDTLLDRLPESTMLFFGHVDWLGSRLTPTCVSKTGMDISAVSAKCPQARFFNGHYHTPLSMGRLHMVGSPLYKDFSDLITNVPRGFTFVDGDKVERIPNPHTYYCVEIHARTEAEAVAFLEAIPEPEAKRVKAYVPNALIELCSSYSDRFLWLSVRPVETTTQAEMAMGEVSIRSSTNDIVEAGVRLAPETLSRDRLRSIGKEIFV